MGEAHVPQLPPEEGERSWKETVLKTALPTSAAGLAGGIITGAAIMSQIPTHVQLAKGIGVETSLESGKTGAAISYGATTVNAPNVPIDTPLPFDVGVHVGITQLDVPLDGSEKFDQYATLISQYKTGVVEPIAHKILEHLAIGGGVGMLVTSAITYGALRHIRKHRAVKKENAQLKDQLGIADEQVVPEKRKRLRKKVAIITGVAATALAAGCGIVQKYQDEQIPPQSSVELKLDKYIVGADKKSEDLRKMLKGVTVSGTGGKLVETAIHGVNEYMKSADKFWENASGTFTANFDAFSAEAKLADLYTNPDIVPIMHLSDLHCNYSSKKYLASVIEKFQPRIVANTGDTFTNSGTMPYEENCRSTIVDAVKAYNQQSMTPIEVVEVAGNHDPKDQKSEDTAILNKRNGYSKTIDDITFVGDDDPEVTIWNPPSEDEVIRHEANEKLKKELASQGKIIADQACDIAAKTGEPPVVLSHHIEASYESILRGCTALALNGHTHNSGPLNVYQGIDKRQVLQHTTGSITGAEIGLTIYQKPNKDAAFSVLYFNKATRTFESIVTAILHTDGTVNFQKTDIPTPASSGDVTKVQYFVNTYSDYSEK